ncbi:MAG: hypothetical protein JW874_08350 [Spirochaetales bacterium]|nr:hypothetical protein [Spirochaetales bacterium]
MKKTAVLIILLIILFSCSSGPQSLDAAGDDMGWEILEILGYDSDYTVVITYFLENNEKTELCDYFQNLVTISTSTAAREEKTAVKVVSRQFLDQIIAEHNFQLAGLSDPNTQKEICAFLGADVIVTGTIRYLKEEECYVANSQVIEVQTGVVLGGINYEFFTSDFGN